MYQLDNLEQGIVKQAAAAGAEQAAQYAGSFLPGGPITGFAIGKVVGLTIGKAFGKSAKAKYRRAKKKGTRSAGGQWAEKDCYAGRPYLDCEGTKCRYKGKPPHNEFVQAYRLRYWPCVNASRDCREKAFKKRLFENYPQKDPFVARRPHYKPMWEKAYERFYQECPPGPGGAAGAPAGGSRSAGSVLAGLGEVDPKWILLAVGGIGVLLLARR